MTGPGPPSQPAGPNVCQVVTRRSAASEHVPVPVTEPRLQAARRGGVPVTRTRRQPRRRAARARLQLEPPPRRREHRDDPELGSRSRSRSQCQTGTVTHWQAPGPVALAGSVIFNFKIKLYLVQILKFDSSGHKTLLSELIITIVERHHNTG